MVKRVDHKSFLTLPKVCQGDSINHWQKVFGKTKHFARYFQSFMLDGDSSSWHTGWWFLFGQSRPTFISCYTRHFLSYPSKPVKRNSSAKVVSPFKPSRIAGLRFQQSSFSLKRVFLKLFLPYCFAVTLKSRKIPNHRLKGLKERENKNFRVWQQQISTTDW